MRPIAAPQENSEQMPDGEIWVNRKLTQVVEVV